MCFAFASPSASSSTFASASASTCASGTLTSRHSVTLAEPIRTIYLRGHSLILQDTCHDSMLS